MHRNNKFLSLFLVSLLISTPVAMANDVWENAQSPQYGKKFGGMLGRGLINIISSPVDLIVHTVEKTKSEPPLIGTLSGIGSGAGCTVLRLGSGALDVVTSWVPNFNGAPVSKSYSNCLEKDASYASRATSYSTTSSSSSYRPASSSTTWTSSTPASSTTWSSSTPSSTNWEGSTTTSTNSSGWTTAAPSTTTSTSTNNYVDKAGSSAKKYVDKAGSSSSSAYKSTTTSHDPYKYVKK